MICCHLFSLSRRWKPDPYLRLPGARRAPRGLHPFSWCSAYRRPGERWRWQDSEFNGAEPALRPCRRTHQPGVLTWPFLAYSQERRPGAWWEEGALAATTDLGSQPFPAICRILFSPTLNLFSSAAQPVSYFLPPSEARTPQTLAIDFPGVEIRSKRGTLH